MFILIIFKGHIGTPEATLSTLYSPQGLNPVEIIIPPGVSFLYYLCDKTQRYNFISKINEFFMNP